MGIRRSVKKLVRLAALSAIVAFFVKKKTAEKEPEGAWKDLYGSDDRS